MKEKVDNPPAFPQLEITSCERDGHGDVIEPFTSVRGGMTLRDWFAGKMLSAIVANEQCAPLSSVYNPNLVARLCYETADAMLQQRVREEWK